MSPSPPLRSRQHARPRWAPASTFLIGVLALVTLSPLLSVPDRADPLAGATRATGSESTDDQRPLAPVLPGGDRFRSHPDLRNVPLVGGAFTAAKQRYDDVADALRSARRDRIEAEAELTLLSASRSLESGRLRAATARRIGFEVVADDLGAAIGELAAEIFMNLDTGAFVTAIEDPPSANDAGRDRALTIAAVDSLIAERAAAVENAARAEATERAAREALAEIGRATDVAMAGLAGSAIQTTVLLPDLTEKRESLESARAFSQVRGTDFSLIALDAYYRAAATNASFDPGCGIRWWAIAGISRVEGRHGTFGGSQLTVAGFAEPPIVGIALNGSNGTAVIADTDGGALDGDPTIDRAVGPMQFIPDTWRRFATDGNDDGEASPHNLYDATLAAAQYLCRSGRDLVTDEALRVAYFSYNRSEAYVTNVLGHARSYQALLQLGDDPLALPAFFPDLPGEDAPEVVLNPPPTSAPAATTTTTTRPTTTTTGPSTTTTTTTTSTTTIPDESEPGGPADG